MLYIYIESLDGVKDQCLIYYLCFFAWFYSTESRRDWLLPIIILSGGSVAVLVMLFIRFLVKKKWTSSYHIQKRESLQST